MRFRNLRIAWSVGWGMACLLVIGLWAWSIPRPITFYGYHVDRTLQSVMFIESKLQLVWVSPAKSKVRAESYTPRLLWAAGFRAGRHRDLHVIGLPLWLLTLAIATLALLPRICQKKLRTVLIATTVVAAVLGLIVWLR